MPEVLSREGLPIVSDFAQGKGTPLVVNVDTGRGYVLRDDNTIVPLNGGGGYFYERDYATLQACIDAAVAARVGTIVLEPGVHTISTGLVQAPASGQTNINWFGLGGAGSSGAILNYTGTGGTALTIKNNTRYRFENIRIEDAGTGAVGLHLTSLAAGSNHGPAVFINNHISGFTTNLHIGSASDEAASELTFINTELVSGTTGVFIQGSTTAINSIGIHFFNLLCASNGTAVKYSAATNGAHGEMSIYGASLSNNDIDFDFVTAVNCTIINALAEKNTGASSLFLRTGSSLGGNLVPSFVQLIRCRPSYAQGATNSHHMELFQVGTYILNNCVLEGTGSGASIHLGGAGDATPYKSTLEVVGGSIFRNFATSFTTYEAGSTTVWMVRNRSVLMTQSNMTNFYDDREYLVNTSGTEVVITKFPFAQTAANLVLAAAPQIGVVATASLPAASSTMDGAVIIEDAGAGDRNLIIYGGGQRFRIDGGAAF
jgi:hypothetical protein